MATPRPLEAMFLVRVQVGKLLRIIVLRLDIEYLLPYTVYMSRIAEIENVEPWEDGLRTGASTIIDAIVSMLERELYKNKGEDVVYEYAIKAVIQKVKDMKVA